MCLKHIGHIIFNSEPVATLAALHLPDHDSSLHMVFVLHSKSHT